MDVRSCHFCGKPSDYKLTVDHENIIRQFYRTAYYRAGKYPCCKVCGDTWDEKITMLQVNFDKQAAELFNSLMVKEKKLDK